MIGDPTVKPIWAQQDKNSEWGSTKLTPMGKSKEEDLVLIPPKEDDYKKIDKMVVKEKTNKKGETTLFLSGGFR